VHPLGQHPSEFVQAVIVLCEQDEVHVPGLLQTSAVQGFVSAHCALFEHVGVMQEPEQHIPVAQLQSAGQVEQFSVPLQISSPQNVGSSGQPSSGMSIQGPYNFVGRQVFSPAQNSPSTKTVQGCVPPTGKHNSSIALTVDKNNRKKINRKIFLFIR